MMLQPFGEITNRTSSPSQQEDSRHARKHSPWTAARHKKKTRSVQARLLNEQSEPPACCASPDALIHEGSTAEDIEREYSLSDGLSSGASGSGVSPHSSPPIDRDQDAEVHPAKAYIVDQQVASPDMLTKLSSAASGKSRSPMWFGSESLQQEVSEAREDDHQQGHLEYSSSAPNTSLIDRFDTVGQQQPDIGKVQCQVPQTHLQGVRQMIQHQEAPAAPAVPAGRRRGLVARRRSWAGAEACRASAAADNTGISRLAASAIASHSSSNQLVAQVAAAAGQKLHETSSYNLCSTLGLGSSCQRSSFDNNTEGFVIRQLPWDACDIRQQDAVGCNYKLAAAGQLTTGATHDSLDWFEQQLFQAAEEDDLATAQQLWGAMQSTGLKPNRKVITSYLMCCHYGGGDPVDAEQVVREMCAAADTEPDAVMLQLLASIDMAWQQLHCGL